MDFCGALAGAVIAEVVDVDAVDDVIEAAIGSDIVHDAEEFILAVEAAVGVVRDVSGVFEFAGRDHLVEDAVSDGEIDGIALMGIGDGGGIGRDGDGIVAEGFFSGPGEIGRIGATGISDEDALHIAEDGDEVLFFEEELSGVEFLVNTLNGY